ncbi:hypothetical protein [Pararhizobium sp.]|uniref:hypothetical protein n=1 Tax=Pararhizobium sp. TaxID=1977563 RepID=UPI0039C93F50
MVRKAGHLDGIAAVAVRQFVMVEPSPGRVITDMVQSHLDALGVPVPGGCRIGHGESPMSLPIGEHDRTRCDWGMLTARY